MYKIYKSDVNYISIGAAILGSGGGGNPYMGKLLVEKAIDKYGPIVVHSIQEMKDDSLVIPVAVMGAPTVFLEKILSGSELASVINAVFRCLKRKATHLISCEVGGVNAMTSLMQASKLHIPVVDGDLIGRAFPEIHMNLTTLTSNNHSPVIIADEKGNVVTLHSVSPRWNEDILRNVSLSMGGTALIALPPINHKDLISSVVSGSVTHAKEIGKAVCDAKQNHTDPVKAGCRKLKGKILFRGKVSDVERNLSGGFIHGTLIIHNDRDEFKIRFQNEYLIAYKNDHVVTTTPNLICVVEEDSGEAISADEIRFGTRVVVYTALPDRRWSSREGLEIVGPRYFNYDIDYTTPGGM